MGAPKLCCICMGEGGAHGAGGGKGSKGGANSHARTLACSSCPRYSIFLLYWYKVHKALFLIFF